MELSFLKTLFEEYSPYIRKWRINMAYILILTTVSAFAGINYWALWIYNTDSVPFLLLVPLILGVITYLFLRYLGIETIYKKYKIENMPRWIMILTNDGQNFPMPYLYLKNYNKSIKDQDKLKFRELVAEDYKKYPEIKIHERNDKSL